MIYEFGPESLVWYDKMKEYVEIELGINVEDDLGVIGILDKRTKRVRYLIGALYDEGMFLSGDYNDKVMIFAGYVKPNKETIFSDSTYHVAFPKSDEVNNVYDACKLIIDDLANLQKVENDGRLVWFSNKENIENDHRLITVSNNKEDKNENIK